MEATGSSLYEQADTSQTPIGLLEHRPLPVVAEPTPEQIQQLPKRLPVNQLDDLGAFDDPKYLSVLADPSQSFERRIGLIYAAAQTLHENGIQPVDVFRVLKPSLASYDEESALLRFLRICSETHPLRKRAIAVTKEPDTVPLHHSPIQRDAKGTGPSDASPNPSVYFS